jgi:hypothetical protein
MTDQTPLTPPPPPPPVAPTTAEAGGPPTTPVPPAPATGGSRGRGGKKTIIGVIAAAIVLGGGYGAYAVYDKLDGGGPQPHDVLPASTDVYFRLDLDPSASQKIDLFKLIRKVPDLADEVGITSDKKDLRELVFREILSNECDSIDYDKDVAPWLGDRIGVGAEVADEKVTIAVQTTDEKASRAGIKKLFACADETYGIAYLNGYAILAPKQADVDASITATKKSSLGDTKKFTDDFAELGNQGIASGWADMADIAKAPAAKEALGTELDELAKAGSVATTLRADGSAIELAVLAGLPQDADAKTVNLAKLPADTVAALSVAGVGDQVTAGFDSLVQEFDSAPSFGGGVDETDPFADPGSFGPQSFIDQIEQETGFKLPEDLATLFGDSLTLTVGSKNLETIPSLSGPDGFSALDIALALTSDKTSALDLVQRIAQLASGAGIPLVASPTDDGAVLATNQGAADAVASSDGSLGDEKAFQSVIPDGDSTSGGFYLDIGTILDKLLQADPPADIRDGIESAKALSAVGVSTSQQDGDRALTRLRVSFD